MFGQEDKVYLSVSNVINRNGEKYIINIDLPNDFSTVSFPDDVVRVTVYEKEKRKHKKTYNSFNILVGEVGTFERLFDAGEDVEFSKLISEEECIKDDDLICYFRDEYDDTCVIFAKIDETDIVVKNTEELEERLTDISYDFENIQRGINRIKRYVYKK